MGFGHREFEEVSQRSCTKTPFDSYPYLPTSSFNMQYLNFKELRICGVLLYNTNKTQRHGGPVVTDETVCEVYGVKLFVPVFLNRQLQR